MNTENLSTLKIHKLTQEQYDRELVAGNIDSMALYLTPDNGDADTLDGKHASDFATNAFSNIKVGTTTITADSQADTLTLVAGSNITLTPNASSDTVTIDAASTSYTHPNSGVTAGTYKKVTVNAQGHITAGSNPTSLSGYGINDAYTKTQVDTRISNAIDNLYDYGTADLTAGSSTLETGKLYFVYE